MTVMNCWPLDTLGVINKSIANTVNTEEALSKDLYDSYHKAVIPDRERSIHEPIKKNSFDLFQCQTPKQAG